MQINSFSLFAKNLIYKIVNFIGSERAEKYFKETLEIEANGGMLTLSGDRRRTPGGVFLYRIKNSISGIERELLFPSGESTLPIGFFENSLKEFTIDQLKIGVECIENYIEKERNRFRRELFKDSQYSILIEKKELLLKRMAELKNQEADRSISHIKDVVKVIEDEETRSSIISMIKDLESVIIEKNQIARSAVDIEEERELMLIKLEAEERRAETKLKFIKRFLAKESVATITGSFLLIIITLVLLFGMFQGVIESKIIENGFLVLLGYFFGQTVTRTDKAEKE